MTNIELNKKILRMESQLRLLKARTIEVPQNDSADERAWKEIAPLANKVRGELYREKYALSL